MFKIVCVTDRKLCSGDFLTRIEEIAKCHPAAVILREKDLTESGYTELAQQVMDICKSYSVECVLHYFTSAAMSLGAESVHLPLHILRGLSSEEKSKFRHIGASCHSIDDVLEAVSLGADRIIAGHIFDTDCKRGLAGRGLDFLRGVCTQSAVPVYAIGGISPENIDKVISAGAAGACVMSGLMKCTEPEKYIRMLKGDII